MRRLLHVLGLAVLLLPSGCDTLPAGRKYTLAKVNDEGYLVEPRRVLASGEGKEEEYDRINPTGYWGIVLKSGYLPYLEAVARPEVVVFVQARIRPKGSAEETLLYERVYLNSEDDTEYMVLNKDSYLPREDIVLLPSIEYSGEDVSVSLRIIGMDQADNERVKQLINAAASTAAVIRPESATGISIFQTVLDFLVENNSDDIEFQYDFAVSEAGKPVEYDGKPYDLVLKPRVGNYALIKTEHSDRVKHPSRYVDWAIHGVRLGIADLLRVATLDIFNWLGGGDAVSYKSYRRDKYRALLGHPFSLDYGATNEPHFILDDDRLASSSDGNEFFLLRGGKLDVEFTYDEKGSDGTVTEVVSTEPFASQAYVVFSIVQYDNGTSVEDLSEAAREQKVIEGLALQTGQMPIEDIEGYVDQVTAGIGAHVAARRLKEGLREELETAESVEEVDTIRAKYEESIRTLLEENPSDALSTELEWYVDKKTSSRTEGLGRSLETKWIRQGQAVTFSYASPGGHAVNLFWRPGATPPQPWTVLLAVPLTPSALGDHAEHVLSAPNALLNDGAYELMSIILSDPPVTRVHRWWVTVDPSLTDAVEGGTSLQSRVWPDGTSATLTLTGRVAAKALRVTPAAGDPVVLKIIDGTNNVVNDTGANLDWQTLELVLIDDDFFADVDPASLVMTRN